MKLSLSLLLWLVSTSAFAGTNRAELCNKKSHEYTYELLSNTGDAQVYLIQSLETLATGRFPIQSARKAKLVELLQDPSTPVEDLGYGAAWSAMRDGRNAQDK